MSRPKKTNDRLDELDGFDLDIPPDEKLPDEKDAYPLAALVNNRDIDEAWQRLRDAKFKLRYEYAKSPEVQERAKAALEEKKIPSQSPLGLCSGFEGYHPRGQAVSRERLLRTVPYI